MSVQGTTSFNQPGLVDPSVVVIERNDSPRWGGHIYTRMEPSEQPCFDKRSCFRWYMRAAYIGIFVGGVLSVVGAYLSNPPDVSWLFYGGVITFGSSGIAGAIGGAIAPYQGCDEF